MSDLLDVLLSDGQRISERRAAPPPAQPANRADQIIAEGDRRRCEYRRLNPTADTAMVYGAQVGYLNAQVRILDAELSTYVAVRNPALAYLTLRLAAVNAAVTVGYTYLPELPARVTSAHQYATPEDPGEAEELSIEQVWLNGVNIAALLCEEVQDSITAEVLKRVRAAEVAR